MRTILAGVMSVGVLVFIIGVGMFLIYQSEAKAIAHLETGETTEHYESLNERALHGFFLMAVGGSVALFTISVDEDRQAKEREKKKGFFF